MLRQSALAISMLFATALGLSAENTAPPSEPAPMHVRDLYPLITSPALFEARDFYKDHFGFAVAFEASWFVYLSGAADGDSRGATIAFMHPEASCKSLTG